VNESSDSHDAPRRSDSSASAPPSAFRLPPYSLVSFVADLHLFSRRSDAPQYLGAIRRATAKSKAFILGGDIFDFRWSTLPTTEATAEAAMRWLEDLAHEQPGCQFHYLLGNHDYCQPFLDLLDQRAATLPNLSWHPFYLRMGDCMFLHGDAAGWQMTPDKLLRLRSRWLQAEPAGRFRHRAYDLLVRTGLHRPIPYLVHPQRRVARRILEYLERVGQGPDAGVRHVYFGHTHRRMANYRYRNVTFHNGGAPIAGQPFHILTVHHL
jgi:UDP-2,3-diacylglucosamine hydrolase